MARPPTAAGGRAALATSRPRLGAAARRYGRPERPFLIFQRK